MTAFKISVCAVVVFVGAVFPQTANAQTVNINAAANRTSIIYRFVQYSPDTCFAMPIPRYKVRSVENGKIVGTKGSFKLQKGPCKGKNIKGIAFRYTPNRQFRGLDKARVVLTMPLFVDGVGTTSRTLKFNIQVK